jgi:hypothetical protein
MSCFGIYGAQAGEHAYSHGGDRRFQGDRA